jgi:hypothetical protein
MPPPPTTWAIATLLVLLATCLLLLRPCEGQGDNGFCEGLVRAKKCRQHLDVCQWYRPHRNRRGKCIPRGVPKPTFSPTPHTGSSSVVSSSPEEFCAKLIYARRCHSHKNVCYWRDHHCIVKGSLGTPSPTTVDDFCATLRFARTCHMHNDVCHWINHTCVAKTAAPT